MTMARMAPRITPMVKAVSRWLRPIWSSRTSDWTIGSSATASTMKISVIATEIRPKSCGDSVRARTISVVKSMPRAISRETISHATLPAVRLPTPGLSVIAAMLPL